MRFTAGIGWITSIVDFVTSPDFSGIIFPAFSVLSQRAAGVFSAWDMLCSVGVRNTIGSPEKSAPGIPEAMRLFDAMNKTKGTRRLEEDVNRSGPQFRIIVRAPCRVKFDVKQRSVGREEGGDMHWFEAV